jgi:hypothetical protein
MKDKDDLNPKSNIELAKDELVLTLGKIESLLGAGGFIANESVKGNFKRSVTEIRQHVMNVQDLIDDKK